jgi:hypothetical protein
VIELGGTLVRTFEVRDENGALANAGAVTAVIHWADGTQDNATVGSPSPTGVYDVTFTPCVKTGWARLEVLGTGANSSWSPDSDFRFWVVDPAELIVSLSEIKDACNAASSTAKDDWFIDQLATAREVIEYHAGAIVAATVVRDANGGKPAILLHERAASVTTVTVDGAAITDYTVDEDAGVLYNGTGASAGCTPFAYGIGNVQITYETGHTVTPSSARTAAIELVRHWYQNGQLGSRPAFGGAAAEPGTPLSFAVPRRVLEHLAPLASNRMPGVG